MLNSDEQGKQPQQLAQVASCMQQARRQGTVTIQTTLGPKTRDEGPSAVMLRGSITSLAGIALQSHSGELKCLDFVSFHPW